MKYAIIIQVVEIDEEENTRGNEILDIELDTLYLESQLPEAIENAQDIISKANMRYIKN